MNKKTSRVVATSVASLFLSGSSILSIAADTKPVVSGYCKVHNSCKGKAACHCVVDKTTKSAKKSENGCGANSCGGKMKDEGMCKEDHTCGGKNTCAGKGWVFVMSLGKKVEMTADECTMIDGAEFVSKDYDPMKTDESHDKKAVPAAKK